MQSINQTRLEELHKRITAALQPTLLDVYDESHLHAGHAGAKTGKGHFAIKISAPCFNGLSRIACHRLIYAALGDMFEHDIHALRIELVNNPRH